MRVLVTGATGFIGSWCVAYLVREGIEVHALSRTVRQDAIVHWHAADIFDQSRMEDVLQAVRPTHLLHLAWDVTPARYWNDPGNLEWVTASLQLLEPFAAAGGTRVVMAGTCAEYAPSAELCSEALTPARPDSMYGASKAALGMLLPSFAKQFGIRSSAWARLFYVYGPGEANTRMIPTAIRTFASRERLTCGAGAELRDYIYVEDAAEALVRLVRSDAQWIMNIGTGEPASARALVEEVSRQMDVPHLVSFVPELSTNLNPQSLVADLSRLQSELGWSPSISYAEGARRYIAWYRDTGSQTSANDHG